MRPEQERGYVRGALEERLMDILWAAPRALRVREVCERLDAPLAYTTVMTTLARLHDKGLLDRERDGLAFFYRPAVAREAYQAQVVDEAVLPLLQSSGEAVLAHFVDLAAGLDEANLRRLEELIAAHRASRREREGRE